MSGIEGLRIANPDFFWAVSTGLVRGISTVAVIGKSNNIGVATPPLTIGANNLLQLFATAAESWEIVSASANDTAAGTGARVVAITSLDENYLPQVDVVVMNGVTPVALPRGAHYLRSQQFTVVSAGSGAVNAGNLTLRVAGAGAVRGFMLGAEGLSKQSSYTVPAGCTLWVSDVSFFCAASGAGIVTADIATFVRQPSGVTLLGFDFTQNAETPSLPFRAGFSLPEKTTIEYRVNAVNVANTDVGVFLTGLLANTALLN
jgi:hypothetical protein